MFGSDREGGAIRGLADRDAGPRPPEHALARRRDGAHIAIGVPRHDARADVEGRGLDHLTAPAHRELRRATADVDVQHEWCFLRARQSDRARAVRGQERLEVVPGGRAHEAAGLLGEQCDDRGGVLLARGLARRDDSAGVDHVARPARFGVSTVNESGERICVDAAW